MKNRTCERCPEDGWHYFSPLSLMGDNGHGPRNCGLAGICACAHPRLQNRKIDLKNFWECMVLAGSICWYQQPDGLHRHHFIHSGLTGVGLKFSWFFRPLPGQPFSAIILVCLISTVRNGLASSAAYIITAISVGPTLDMGFPLLVAHFIMIWFSINWKSPRSDWLRRGCGIAKADPWRTMFTSFKFSKGLYILPFLFYYRPEILLQGSLFDFAITTAVVLMALISLAAAIEGYLGTSLFLYERALLVLCSVPLFIPGRHWDALGVVIFLLIFFLQKRRVQH